MNIKILIGSILVLIILLLISSIPAIQLKTIKEKTYSDLIHPINIKEVKEKKEMTE